MAYVEYSGRYANPKCPICSHPVFNHWDGSRFYCVKCQVYFNESGAKA